MASALVLLGHGSRDPAWREPMDALAAQVAAAAPHAAVRCAYLELCAPDLAAACAALVAGGADRIAVLPVFLGAGRHVREDVPAMVQALQAAHPGVAFSLAPAVGSDSRLLAALTAIALDTLF